MSWIIYKHTNKINGKVYIGQTCQKPEDRWLCGHGYPNNKYFDRAIKKYGWETGFTHEVIHKDIQTLDEANRLEIAYIEQYHSYIKDPQSNGYNLTKGGDNRDNFGKIVLQIDDDFNIVNSFVSIGAAGRAIGDSHGTGVSACCRRISIKCKGYYFVFADDYNENWKPKNDEHSKPIVCLDTGKSYKKISDFEKEMQTTVKRYNNEMHASGLKLVYLDEYNDSIKNEYLLEKQKKIEAKKIICFENNKEYCDIFELITDLQISENRIPNIYKALADSGYSVNGYHFVWKSEWYENWSPRELKQNRYSIIVCFETKEEFKTYKEAALLKNANESEICKCCKANDGVYTSGGLHWCFKENLATFRINKKTLGKSVYCFETKKYYENAEAAALELKCLAKSIRNCCKRIYKTASGYHFCYSNDVETYEIYNKKEAKKVFCVETKVLYASVDDAAKQNNLSSGSIFNVCNKRHGCLTCGGLHWCYEDEKDSFVIPLPKLKKVRCIETNEIYDNCTHAGKEKMVNSAKIGMVCNKKRKTAGGLHWEYVN